MDKMKWYQLILPYIKKNRKVVTAFCIFSCLFALVFSLYAFPVEAVAYASLLCITVAVIFTFVDYLYFYRKHKKLQQIKNHIAVSMDELPEPASLLEQDYQELLTLLNQAKARQLEQADNSRSQLIDYLTLWTHQIKTPIAAMDLLLQSGVQADNAQLGIELFKIEQYIGMVLQYLRMEDMSSDLMLQSYSLDVIVKQAIRKYSKLFILKKIRLELAPIQTWVLTDEKWLVFVLEQLLSNALKYTPEGGTISICMDAVYPKTLVITDTGLGIQAEDIPRVFEKGFTGYNGRIDKKSTGIGLYLSKQILTKLSHNISVHSAANQGTTVKIDLATVDYRPE